MLSLLLQDSRAHRKVNEFMGDLFSGIYLVDIILFVAMLGVFVFLTQRAVATKEYTGYGLGILIGLFFVVIYSSLTPQQSVSQTDITTTVSTLPALNFVQITLPTICGVIVGAGMLLFFAVARIVNRRYTILVATLTTFNVIILFMMVVGDPVTRRMVGIFGMALVISVVVCAVVFGRPDMQQAVNYAQALDPGDPNVPSGAPLSTLEQMRQRFRQ